MPGGPAQQRYWKHSSISPHTASTPGASSDIPARVPVPSRLRFNGKRTSKYMTGTLSDSAQTPACGRTVGQARTLQQGPCRTLQGSQCCPVFPTLTGPSHDELTAHLCSLVHPSASLLGSSLVLYSFSVQGQEHCNSHLVIYNHPHTGSSALNTSAPAGVCLAPCRFMPCCD